LRLRLQSAVSVDVLDKVVEAWVSLLQTLRPEMELGLAVLHMNSGLPENLSPLLTRSNVPFISVNMSHAPSSTMGHQNSHMSPRPSPAQSTSISSGMPIIQPSFSILSNTFSRSFDWQVPRDNYSGYLNLPVPDRKRVSSAPGVPTTCNNSAFLGNRRHQSGTFAPSANDHPSQRDWGHESFVSPHRGFGVSAFHSQNFNSLRLETKDSNLTTAEVTLPMPPDSESNQASFLGDQCRARARSPQRSVPTLLSDKFEEFVQKGCGAIKYVLSKHLHVRELVNIRPGTKLGRMLQPNSVGVVMKHSGEFRVGPHGDFRLKRDRPMCLTVRLLNGSWLNKVRVEDVQSRGERANLNQYLRLGDILWTRFGLAAVRQLHPESGQITAEYPWGFRDTKVDLSRNEIHEKLRRVLFGKKTCMEDRKNELKWEPLVSDPAIMVPSTLDDSDSQEDAYLTLDEKNDFGLHAALDRVQSLQLEQPRFLELNDINWNITENQSKIEIDQQAENLSCPKTRNIIEGLKNSLEISSVSDKSRDSMDELVNTKGFDNILQENQLVFTEGPSVVLEQGRESGDSPRATRQSGSPYKFHKKQCTNNSEIKKIYDTDIWSVLSTEEVVQHLAQRPVVALEYDDLYLTPKFGSKREGPPMQTWEEKCEFNSDEMSGGYDDRVFSPESVQVSSEDGTERKMAFPT